MESIYKDAKKGYKIAISKAVNTAVKTHVFKDGWVLDYGSMNKMVDEVFTDYFVKIVNGSLNSTEDKAIFRGELAEKIELSYHEFSIQEPTPKQIYYYVHMCIEAGEIPRSIWDNKTMFLEIRRLKEATGL